MVFTPCGPTASMYSTDPSKTFSDSGNSQLESFHSSSFYSSDDEGTWSDTSSYSDMASLQLIFSETADDEEASPLFGRLVDSVCTFYKHECTDEVLIERKNQPSLLTKTKSKGLGFSKQKKKQPKQRSKPQHKLEGAYIDQFAKTHSIKINGGKHRAYDSRDDQDESLRYATSDATSSGHSMHTDNTGSSIAAMARLKKAMAEQRQHSRGRGSPLKGRSGNRRKSHHHQGERRQGRSSKPSTSSSKPHDRYHAPGEASEKTNSEHIPVKKRKKKRRKAVQRQAVADDRSNTDRYNTSGAASMAALLDDETFKSTRATTSTRAISGSRKKTSSSRSAARMAALLDDETAKSTRAKVSSTRKKQSHPAPISSNGHHHLTSMRPGYTVAQELFTV